MDLTIVAKQVKLSISFVIVGGGVGGLACAIALRRVGHSVIVLEKNSTIESQKSSGCRLPPNVSKILYHWGLEQRLREIAVKSQAVELQIFETGELLGRHVWDEEMLKETRGEFMFTHYSDLRKLLYDTAILHGAEVRLGAAVISIDPSTAGVTLASGEVLRGDIIIGADGSVGLCRELLEEENDVRGSKPISRMRAYSATVPQAALMQDPELSFLCNRKLTTMFGWFGDGRCVLGYLLGGTPEFALYNYQYSKDPMEDGSWEHDAPIASIQDASAHSEPRLQKLSKLASHPICIPVIDYPDLEDWVQEHGRMVLIGEAAHPLPPGSVQQTAMTIEDGAVLAKLFSHLRAEDQISSFLYAFQDLRQPRCNRVMRKEIADIQFMTLPPGEYQQMRDGVMKSKRDAGLNVLDASEGMEESQEWAEIKDVFGYDAEDEADNWWVEWGILRERAKGVDMACGMTKNIVVAQEAEAFSPSCLPQLLG